jgi:Pectinesterase
LPHNRGGVREILDWFGGVDDVKIDVVDLLAAAANLQAKELDNPLGWNNFGNPAKEKTARFAEYKCTGLGADRGKRVPWSRELTDDEASNLTIEKLLGGEDQWNPSEAK